MCTPTSLLLAHSPVQSHGRRDVRARGVQLTQTWASFARWFVDLPLT
jgi:hypothetical protein